MHFKSTFLLAALASIGSAAPVKAPVIFDFSVERTDAPKAVYLPNFQRKALSLTLKIENEYSYYLTELSVGTPGQKLKVNIDTGSSDLWVLAPSSGFKGGTFDGSKSSTFKSLNNNFFTGYADGSWCSGSYVTDDVAIGSTKIKDLQFGYATKSYIEEGILGVGYMSQEAVVQFSKGKPYDNFPEKLKKQGLIAKNAFSLYLNSLESQSGSIVFGAIDRAKYTGDLAMLDVVNADGSDTATSKPSAFFVDLKGLSVSGDSIITKSYPVLLDTGTTLIHAPGEVVNKVCLKLGGKFDPSLGVHTIDCDANVEDVQFDFGSTSVNVPGKDLIFKVDRDSDKQLCILGLNDSMGGHYILGDVFLRSAYVYFDLDDNKIGLAQVKYTEESDLQLVE